MTELNIKDDVRLAIGPRDAAKAMSVSPRLLWAWTNEGKVPHVRMGRRVLYPVEALSRWLDEQANKGVGA
jgi:excisionase family DNA binding protein